ncbi:SDR family NAD(P)-dependent oxidoreductase [Kitasatospora sp. NPDC048365]|uniref:SDR family NAD(P)-dependent oxidoreductase n=1 Tax=Kitasatospora sp. NPDC048365 TaxID=3364050 RepID=UPI00371A9387
MDTRVPDRSLAGRVALVTGGTGGIGMSTAVGLARRGAEVIVTGRDPGRGRDAVRTIAEAAGVAPGAVRLRIADLGVLGDVRRLADEVLADHPRLHLLVNNAGVNNGSRRTTPDGLEENLAVNAVAPVLLTRLLHDRLAASAEPGRASRVVLVSSSAHKMVRRAADALGDPQAQAAPYVAMTAYARSKLLALMAGFALARELGGGPVSVAAVDPGPADTGMTRSMDRTFLPPAMRAGWALYYRLGPARRSPDTAALSPLAAATAAELEGRTGLYLDARGRPARTSPASRDEQAQRAALTLLDGLAAHTNASVAPSER